MSTQQAALPIILVNRNIQGKFKKHLNWEDRRCQPSISRQKAKKIKLEGNVVLLLSKKSLLSFSF